MALDKRLNKQMKKYKDTMIVILTIIILLLGMVAVNKSFTKSETKDCKAWSEHAEEFSNWYATVAQREQCDALGVYLPLDRT